MNCTFYINATSTSDLEVDLNSLLKAIRDGRYKDKVLEFRGISDEEQKRNFKATKLPAFTVSGTFETKKADSLKEHSGLIAIDFDQIEDIDEARSLLYADKHTFAGFKSVSGNGLCLIVKIDGKKHSDAFAGLEKYYFSQYGLVIDTATKNVNRLRFISYDPELYANPKSEKFSDYLPKPKGRKPNIPKIAFAENDIEYVIQQIENNRVDITQDYQDWVDIGLAIASEFGANGLDYYQRISQFHPKYDAKKTERKYRSYKTVKSISISTFFYHAKKAGIEITTPQTKIIANVANYAKKGRRTPEQAIEQLEKIDGIKPEESQKIVQQVFDGAEPPTNDDEDDLVFQVEEFLKRQLEIRYNEVTLKYESNGKPMNDRDFNSAYLDCKKIIPKVSKDLFLSCIDSDRTKTYNPIKEFFAQHYHRRRIGMIRHLADCIISPNGKVNDFDYIFIRKWMIGSVAMWHKGHSPLMLVLAGDKQNTGKSHFFRYLLPNELQPYYAESELTGDKDENLMMCNKILIMNDEMSNKSKRDITVMKKLCSAQWFNLRKPYGKLSEDFRRIATLCGTSNSLELLSDPTGNRRIIPIEVHSIKQEKYNSIDKIDLWIEAYNAYMEGEAYQLTSADISLLNESTHSFEESSPEMELFLKYFRKPFDDYSFEELTNAEIKSHIEINTHQRISSKKLGMELKRLGFQRFGKKEEGVTKQVYRVIRNG